MAKVTIVVPIYNVEKYLPKCLDSLINQTFKDIEIWAISDGSPDNSVKIIKEYAKKDKRVKCIEKENGGYGSVLEYAIKNIKTKYFLICDPDDWISEDAIEVLYGAAEDNKLDFVRAAYYDVYSDNNEKEFRDGISYPQVFVPEANKVYTDDAEYFLFMSDSPHAKLYKTELAKHIKFPHHVSYTDGILYKFYIPKVKRAMYIDKPLAYYLVDREGNTVTDVKPKIADYHKIVFDSMMKQYDKLKGNKDMLLYRIFLHFIYMNSEISRINNMDDYKEKRELAYDMLKELSKRRKEIYPYIKKYETPRKRFAYFLMLNPVTSRKTFLHFSKKHYKMLH